MNESLGSSTNYTLLNNDTTTVLDIWGDDKFVSLSQYMDVTASSTIALNINLTELDTVLELTDEYDKLDIHSYVTIKSSNGIEIVKVTEKISNIRYTIERGQFNTLSVEHNSAEAVLYFPKFVYFILLP